MTQYLISFPSPAMQVSAEDLPAVGRAANAVVDDMKAAGVYVYAGGISDEVEPVLVAADGTVTADTHPESRQLSGGMTVVEVDSREEALAWAARLATACQCSQEVREIQ